MYQKDWLKVAVTTRRITGIAVPRGGQIGPGTDLTVWPTPLQVVYEKKVD